MTAAQIYVLAMVIVALAAAVFDAKAGRIPNALTFGALVAAIPLHIYFSQGVTAWDAAKWPLLGTVICGLPPLVGFRFGWVAGGDVKLIAAMGALGGVTIGVESVFLALLAAAGFVFIRLCWDGVFWRTLVGAGRLALARVGAATESAPATPELSRALRFGPFAAVGAVLCLVIHGGFA